MLLKNYHKTLLIGLPFAQQFLKKYSRKGCLIHSANFYTLKSPKLTNPIISTINSKKDLSLPAGADKKIKLKSPPNMEINFLKPNDKEQSEEVLQFLLDHFVIDEPLFEGLNIGREEVIPFYKEIIKICSQEIPVSMLVRSKNEENKLVAVMLGQLINRYGPQSDFYNVKGNEGDKPKYSKNVDLYCQLVHVCESSVWDLLPKNMVKLCSIAFLSVHKEYRKLDIGYQTTVELANYLRQMGDVQGFVSELSAVGTQKIAKKVGFELILQIPYNGWKDENGNQIIKSKDGSKSLDLQCLFL